MLFGSALNGQFRQFVKANYQWDHEMMVPEMKDIYKDEDAVSLSEFDRISVQGLKSEFMHVYFEKKAIIKYNTQKGVNNHNAFLLPKATDPFYEGQFCDINSKSYMPFFNTRILHFSARILKTNGSIENAIFRYAFPIKNRIIDNQFEPVFLYYFQITNLEPGDVLEYHYKYEVPYDVNWLHFNSGRIFYEGEMFKQEYTLQVEQNKKLRTSFLGEKADKEWSEGSTLYRSWEKKDLPPAIDEPGSRPYLDREHIVYKLNENNLSYVYRHPRTSQILPSKYFNYVAKLRQPKDFWYRRVARRNYVFDKQSRMFRSWINSKTTNLQSPAEKLNALNSDIAQNFQFYNDDPYYALQDMGLELMGEFTQSKRIRDISRHNIYTKLFNRLEFNNYKVLYVLDKRVGILSEEYPSNLYFNERLFYSNDSNRIFVLPKRRNFGYEVNELPFYLEGTNAFGYTIDELFDDGIISFNTDSIPLFSYNNRRRTDSEVTIKLESNTISFNTQLSLEGQFSTLTRGVYLYNELDSTINPSYGNRIFEIGSKTYVRNQSLLSFDADNNRHAKFQFDYYTEGRMYGHDDTLHIPLRDLVNAVTWENMDFGQRHLTYYPDFGFEDNFEYNFKLEDGKFLPIRIRQNIRNDFGYFKIDLAKTDDQNVLLKVDWVLSSRPIPADKILMLEQFYLALESLNAIDLKAIAIPQKNQ